MSRVSIFLFSAAMSVLIVQGNVRGDDNDVNNPNANHLKTFVNGAKTSLTDAIKTAEHETGGKAIDAIITTAGVQQGTTAGGQDNYMVTCLVGNKFMEVTIDGQNGSVLNKRETTFNESGLQRGFMQQGAMGQQGAFGNTNANTNTGNKGTDANDNKGNNPYGNTYGTTGNVQSGNTGNTSHYAQNNVNTAGGMNQPIRIQKASDLIGKHVQNPQGEKLGKVENLAIDTDHNFRVAYAVVEMGGFLGVGEKWYAVPFEALNLPPSAEHFVLNISKDRLKSATGFEKDRWPQMTDPNWATQTFKIYGERPYWQTGANDTSPEVPLHIVKASEFMKQDVKDNSGQKVGDVQDLAINPDNGQVVFAVIDSDRKLIAVPPSVIKNAGTGSIANLNLSKAQLQNEREFDKNHWASLGDPTFIQSTYKFYGQDYQPLEMQGQH